MSVCQNSELRNQNHFLAVDALMDDLVSTQEESTATQLQLPSLGAFVKGDAFGTEGEIFYCTRVF